MISRMALSISVAALALASVAGCKSQRTAPGSTETTSANQPAGTTAQPMTETTPAAGTSTAGQLSSDDKDFMTKACQGNMAEVAIGHEAAKKGMSNMIRNFGNRMVTDHTKANNELKQLAQSKGVTLPTAMTDEQKKTQDDLSKLSGQKFDMKYADDMVDEHEKDVKEFQKQAKDAKDPDLRNWAAKTVPILEEHLKMAREMKAETSVHPKTSM